LILLGVQELILLLWWQGWTAASAFLKHGQTVGWAVLDPYLEHVLMVCFWVLAALVTAITIEHLSSVFFDGNRSDERHFYVKRVAILTLEAFLLLSIHSSFVSSLKESREVNVSASTSPDGIHEIQLVPMSTFLDTNGLVIARAPHQMIWRTAGEIGDLLSEARGGRFVWSSDNSKVYLLLNIHEYRDHPMLGYDFRQNANVNPGTYLREK
jgi:hypothetical protein